MRRSRARPRLMFSTTVRPASGRAVLRRLRGGRRRPRANRSSRDWSMPNKMLVDATHPEETRVVVLRGHRVEEFDFESASRKQLRGNIYLAKVTRVEPSLQAAFVDYGGNRHGFLAFSEIHPDYYRIPVGDRPPDRFRPQERTPEPEPDAAMEAESADDAIPEEPPESNSEPTGSDETQEIAAREAMTLEPAPKPDAPAESVVSPEEEPPFPTVAVARIEAPTLRDEPPSIGPAGLPEEDGA